MISIYALINPINDQVFYIGASSRPTVRLYRHVCAAISGGTSYKDSIIRDILMVRKDVDMEILDTCHLKETIFLETFYIDLFKSYGFNLPQYPKSTYPINKPQKDFSEEILEKTVTIKLRADVFDAMDILAEELYMNRNTLVSLAIKRYLKIAVQNNGWKFQEAKRRLILKFLPNDYEVWESEQTME